MTAAPLLTVADSASELSTACTSTRNCEPGVQLGSTINRLDVDPASSASSRYHV
ncbi:MAG: hypothetical protein KC619_32575 [Myxococcales bacterium]|nr:hypothetical protein [Myxococcales bacterium]